MVRLSRVASPSPLVLSTCPKVVLDASPLISILVLKYAFTLAPDAAKAVVTRSRVASYLEADSAQAAMIRLFDHVRGITTTSHVIGELQGLQELTGDSQTAFWQAAMNWLAFKGLDENLITLLELNSNSRSRTWVCEIGPTDSSLIQLAIRERAPLLTDDRRTLVGRARQNGVDCRVVEEELRQYR